jgi:hypothetical protein
MLEDAPLRRRLGGAGRERVARHFDINECVKGLEEIYDDVVGAGAAGHKNHA